MDGGDAGIFLPGYCVAFFISGERNLCKVVHTRTHTRTQITRARARAHTHMQYTQAHRAVRCQFKKNAHEICAEQHRRLKRMQPQCPCRPSHLQQSVVFRAQNTDSIRANTCATRTTFEKIACRIGPFFSSVLPYVEAV